jgi:hypothetical protein
MVDHLVERFAIRVNEHKRYFTERMENGFASLLSEIQIVPPRHQFCGYTIRAPFNYYGPAISKFDVKFNPDKQRETLCDIYRMAFERVFPDKQFLSQESLTSNGEKKCTIYYHRT